MKIGFERRLNLMNSPDHCIVASGKEWVEKWGTEGLGYHERSGVETRRTRAIAAAHKSYDACQYVHSILSPYRSITKIARLRVDLPTSQATPDNAWRSLRHHLVLLLSPRLFAILGILRPVVGLLGTKSMGDKTCYGCVNNADYVCMKSLTGFAGDDASVVSYLAEGKAGYGKLANVTVEHAYMFCDCTDPPFRDMNVKGLGDLPRVY
ncbi:hypothetical protein BJ165DRAFT_1409374 [Panaeolus papilionaceus]|nr:hypothetical protein BJ165DRAFT_1409374 [Panaeolus papilionaceus]